MFTNEAVGAPVGGCRRACIFDLLSQRQLLDEVTDQDRATWQGSSPIDWANESFAISVSPEVEYCVGSERRCWYGADNEHLDQGEPEKAVAVDRSYIATHTPTVRDRLLKAGVRLAGLLSLALGD